jgi:hypothetical protein
MDGLFRERLAYCDNCKTMRAYFEGTIPPVPDSKDTGIGSDYVCATCYSIIATFTTVTPEEFAVAAEEIHDDDLKRSLLTT